MKTLLLAMAWGVVLLALVAYLAYTEARGAPAPFARNAPRVPNLAGNYLLCWGGCEPGFGLRLNPDGTQETTSVLWQGGLALQPMYGQTWTGHWKYDRASKRLVVVESYDGGDKTLTYWVDVETMRGRVEGTGTAIELRLP